MIGVIGICWKHRTAARTLDDGGWPLCDRCFTEARERADAVAAAQAFRVLALRWGRAK